MWLQVQRRSDASSPVQLLKISSYLALSQSLILELWHCLCPHFFSDLTKVWVPGSLSPSLCAPSCISSCLFSCHVSFISHLIFSHNHCQSPCPPVSTLHSLQSSSHPAVSISRADSLPCHFSGPVFQLCPPSHFETAHCALHFQVFPPLASWLRSHSLFPQLFSHSLCFPELHCEQCQLPSETVPYQDAYKKAWIRLVMC